MQTDMSIQEVSERIGLPKSTLRYWEKEFEGIISPTRTPGGQRRYSETDMEVINVIRDYKKSGMSLSQIKGRLQSEVKRMGKVENFQIDQLAARIAHTVRKEIYNYFDQGRHGNGGDNSEGGAVE